MGSLAAVEKVRSQAVLQDAIRLIPSYVTTGLAGYVEGGPVGALASMIAKLGL